MTFVLNRTKTVRLLKNYGKLIRMRGWLRSIAKRQMTPPIDLLEFLKRRKRIK